MSKVAQHDRTRFQELMGNADQWASIDDLVSICDSEDFWSEEFLASMAVQAKKNQIRRMIKTLKEDGWPLWASVETTNEEGETCRVYKQELLFDIEDYRQVVVYHGDRAKHHRRMALGYESRCKKRFNVQLDLPFGDDRQAPKPR